MTKLTFHRVPGEFAVCRLAPDAPLPQWTQAALFCSITRTSEELSVVCPAECVPKNAQVERGWACLKLQGPFPFQMTGILASFIGPLAENAIPVFAVSTFDTDYVLLKEELLGRALAALAQAGHELV